MGGIRGCTISAFVAIIMCTCLEAPSGRALGAVRTVPITAWSSWRPYANRWVRPRPRPVFLDRAGACGALREPKWGKERYIFVPDPQGMVDIVAKTEVCDEIREAIRRIGSTNIQICIECGYIFPASFEDYGDPLEQNASAPVSLGDASSLELAEELHPGISEDVSTRDPLGKIKVCVAKRRTYAYTMDIMAAVAMIQHALAEVGYLTPTHWSAGNQRFGLGMSPALHMLQRAVAEGPQLPMFLFFYQQCRPSDMRQRALNSDIVIRSGDTREVFTAEEVRQRARVERKGLLRRLAALKSQSPADYALLKTDIGAQFGTRCENCDSLGKKLSYCAACGMAAYCSRECQQQDWKAHKPDCLKGRSQGGM